MKLINEEHNVCELSTEEMQNTNGGGDTWIWFGKFIRDIIKVLDDNPILLQG